MIAAAQCPTPSAQPMAHRKELASYSDIANRTTTRRSPGMPSDSGLIVCQPAKCTIPADVWAVNPSMCRQLMIRGSVSGKSCVSSAPAALCGPNIGLPPIRLTTLSPLGPLPHEGTKDNTRGGKSIGKFPVAHIVINVEGAAK
jgi:hypothetical protein